jgi:exosortase K
MLAVVALAMWALKRHYSTADVESLTWILKPVAALSGVATGVGFEWEPGSGYLARERFFVIAKPCAGVNFMLAAFGMIGFLLAERVRSWKSVAGLVALAAGTSYVAAIAANTLRIVVALWLLAHPVRSAFWTEARLHRLEGVAIYFGMLVALHLVVTRAARLVQRRPPELLAGSAAEGVS